VQNEKIIKVLKALAHPQRLGIVERLKDGEVCVCEMNEESGFSQSNLSQHLKILRDADVLTFRKDGNKVLYSVRNRDIFEIIDALKVTVDKDV